MSKFLLTLFCTLTVLAMCLQSRGSEIINAKISPSIVFPECGDQGSFSCEYDLAISLYDLSKEFAAPDDVDQIFSVLPYQLLSPLIFGISSGCNANDLATSLKNSLQVSKSYDGIYVSGLSADLAVCFAGGISTPTSGRELLLLWQGGKIRGWLECQRQTCSLHLQVTGGIPSDGMGVGLSVEHIAASASEALLLNLENVIEKILLHTNALDVVPGDGMVMLRIESMDESAVSIISAHGGM